MTSSTLISADKQIQQDVQDELGWTLEVDDAGIGVAVEAGTVTLSGNVDDLPERQAAVRAAQRTVGVMTVVDDLVVHPSSAVWQISDATLARSVADSIRSYTKLPDTVRATIDHHIVTLSGEVQWRFQRDNAQHAVEGVKGVALVVNGITLHARASGVDMAARIRQALVRNATLDADAIHVMVDANTATLTGHVRSFAERQEAIQAAWSSPHVTTVIDYLTVSV